MVDKLWDRLRWLLVLMLGMQQFANLLPLLIVQYNPYCSLLPGRGLLISMCTFSIMAQAGLASLGIAVVYFMGLYSLFTRNTWRLIMRTAVNKTICCAIFLGTLAMVFAPIAALGLFYVVGGSLVGAVWSLSNALDAKLALLSILMPTVLMMWSQLQHLKLPALNLGKGCVVWTCFVCTLRSPPGALALLCPGGSQHAVDLGVEIFARHWWPSGGTWA